MSDGSERKQRLHELIDLALTYTGLTRTALAGQMRRDHSRLYPPTGNPKLNAVTGLAEALEWPVDEVVRHIREGDGAPPADAGGMDYATLDREARAVHQKGDFKHLVELGRRMFAAAQTADQRARACRIEAIGWAEQVRLSEALAAFRRGLAVPQISKSERVALRANLANTYCTAWDLPLAEALASSVIAEFQAERPVTRTDRESVAFAHYVRGNALRRLLAGRPADAHGLATRAKSDLEEAEHLYREIARDFDADYLGGVAHTCRGALLEVSVELGLRTPEAAVDEMLAELAPLDGSVPWPEGDWLESYGWWCDFGATIAVRYLRDRKLQQAVAVFSQKLQEITARFRNWSLVERAMSMEYARLEQLAETAGVGVPCAMDADDLRLVVGTIGRFPHFRLTGWKLLEAAGVVRKQNAKKRM